jgi:hypothetical protein
VRGKRLSEKRCQTIVPTHGTEKTGWPTQKPEGVLRRIVVLVDECPAVGVARCRLERA